MRLAQLSKKIREAGRADREKLIAWGCLTWGSRGERVREYIDVLVMAGLVSLTPKEVHWVGGDE